MFQAIKRRPRFSVVAGALILVSGFTSMLSVPAASDAKPVQVGVVEHLGEKIPLGEMTFNDEQGKPIALKSLFDKPVVLTLVYFRCPGICTPLLQELASVVQKSKLVAGKDYTLVTIGFDPDEGPELAGLKRQNMLKSMTKKPIPESSWRFLTGDEKNIKAITEAVGFKYARDKNGQDYVHPATLTFLNSDGLIARYLTGTRFNPADFELAVIDASQGRARSFMKKIQRLCYSYEPEAHGYVLKINRIILGATLVFAGLFVVFLVFIKPRKTGEIVKGDAKDGKG